MWQSIETQAETWELLLLRTEALAWSFHQVLLAPLRTQSHPLPTSQASTAGLSELDTNVDGNIL